MDQRMVEFIRALRTVGVRISISESSDAFNAAQYLGIKDRDIFQTSLRTTLVKDSHDFDLFDQLFELYFNIGDPPLINAEENLTPEQKQMLAAALKALLEQLKNNPPQDGDQEQQQGQQGQQGHPLSNDQFNQLMQLLQALLSGKNPSQQDMDQAGQQVGLDQVSNPYRSRRMEERMRNQMGMDQLDELLEQLYQELAKAGMSQDAIDELRDMLDANRDALADQINKYVGRNIAQQNLEQRQERQENAEDISQVPFDYMGDDDFDQLRSEMRRLAAQLRTRAALRQKRGKTGQLDVRRTMRRNLRNGNIPIELAFKHRVLKPKLTLLCDISGSMYNVARFMLNMIYELQDQTSKTRSFAFYYDLYEISTDMETGSIDEALYDVMQRMPHVPYATDLGSCLEQFTQSHFDAVDQRTTVIFMGDARNNHYDPRLDCMEKIQHRAKQVIWLNPEPPHLWDTGDSDMSQYVPFCTSVHQVRNLAQLADAIDHLLTG